MPKLEDLLKYYRSDNEKLRAMLLGRLEDIENTLIQGGSWYTVSTPELILIELLARELERSEKNMVKPYPTGQDFNISLTSGGDSDA